MDATFSYYSVAYLFALTLNTPTAIMLGEDHRFWVVDRGDEVHFSNHGYVLLSYPQQM